MRAFSATIVAVAYLFTSCAVLPPQDPTASEHRPVRPASDVGKTLAVVDGMVFYDSLARNKGIRFPGGTYVLEAEDDVYWYFRAPAPLEFRIFRSGQVVDERNSPGGLMLGKATLRLVPAAGYIDGEGQERILVHKLGGEFLRLEGRYWKKTF